MLADKDAVGNANSLGTRGANDTYGSSFGSRYGADGVFQNTTS